MIESEVTLGVLGEKLDNLIKSFREHAEREEAILLGSQERPGLIVLVDRLNEAEKIRKWYFRAIWTAIIALLVKIFWGIK